MFNRILAFAAATFVVLTTAVAVRADDVPFPQGDVILTVTGTNKTNTADGTLQFDRDTLSALGLQEIVTSTIWTEGEQTFEGVSLVSLLEATGAESGTLRATAINDYTVEIPFEDAVENGPIVATTMNGEIMSVRDKGPLWIIYPYDSSADYRTEVIYSRSIWQLDRIEIVE